MSETRDCVVHILASGSSGNSVFIRSGDVRLLVDAGISRKRILQGLRDVGEDPADLSALLLTHEHIDHIKGISVLHKHLPDLQIFATPGTAAGYHKRQKERLAYHRIEAGRLLKIGHLEIWPFAIRHDANEPVGYRIDTGDGAIGFATDLGEPTDRVVENLKDCRGLILESNYDLEMLRNGPYPLQLKKRVASSLGHLSNRQACHLLKRIATPNLRVVALAHMSEKNNSPLLAHQSALSAFGAIAQENRPRVVVARRGTPVSFEV